MLNCLRKGGDNTVLSLTKQWTIPVPAKIRTWHKAKKPVDAWILARRLLKFVDTTTPPQYEQDGERWGEGQIYLEAHDGEVYRGHIALPKEEESKRADDWKDFWKTLKSKKQNCAPIPLWLLDVLPLKYPTFANEYPNPDADGLSIKIRCSWIAKKHSSTKIGRWDTAIPVWRWELLPLSTSFALTIEKFRQNKTFRWNGVLHPKRLFFETTEGEHGYFSQRNDPENIVLNKQSGHFTDPLHPSG